ncbi:MAG: FMN-binding negative transcriptional regulator [Rubricella sp.]
MHTNPAFRGATEAQNRAFAAERGFGTLAINGPEGPLMSHVPFALSDTWVDLHLAPANPILHALKTGPLPAVLSVTGPDGYVSPDWYGVEDQVPTWNYIAVHIRGALDRRPIETLRSHLDDLSARFEPRLDKRPWTMEKMSEDAAAGMMWMIFPVRLVIERIDGTWKLNQNKPEVARRAAADRMEAGVGQGLAPLAALMRTPPA